MDCCVLLIYLSPKGNLIILGWYNLSQVYKDELRLQLLSLYYILYSIIGPLLSMVPTVFVKLSVVINPVLYIALNSQVTFYIKYI